jgi:Sigma-70 region 2
MYVSSRAVAEEVVQEAWLGVFAGLHRFEGRSSLKTWAFRILTNTAKTRGEREGRSVPFSSLAGDEADDEPAVDADRFLGADHRWAGHWSSSPRSPRDVPEERLLRRRGGRADRGRDRGAAGEPARRDHAPRRGWLRGGRGLRDPRRLGGEPAGAAPPGSGQGAGRARGLSGGGGGVSRGHGSTLACSPGAGRGAGPEGPV